MNKNTCLEIDKATEDNFAIRVKNVDKAYKLYEKKRDRIKDAFGFGKNNYKLHYALKNVTIDINKGETVGIIGKNGSGKSTILKIITGVLHQTSGDVYVNGRISALLELGAGFNMEYTGIENIFLNGTMMGFSEKEIEQKLPAILEFADIGDYVYQPVKTYSSGMFVRLAFAVAINIDPEILIVDEALSVGDIFFQAKCYHKFEEFKEKGKTIIFVSHDLSSISKYCDRVFLLNEGVLLGEGNAKEMIDVYKRVLVGQYFTDESDDKEIFENQFDKIKEKNNTLLEYGDGKAKIIKYYITDDKNFKTNSLIKGSKFTIHMYVKFLSDIDSPIFAFTIKNAKGTEITGTNTMIEKAFLESVDEGQVYEILFTQDMNLQGGEYLLSLGVTGYTGDSFVVYHRLYDVENITVVSDKDSVGFYDMNSQIQIKNLEV